MNRERTTEAIRPSAAADTVASLYGLKTRFVRLLTPMTDLLVHRGVHPDTVTLAAIPIQLAIGTAILVGSGLPLIWLAVGPLGLGLMAINAIDGSLARSTGTSRRGAALNEVVDRFGDLVILTSLSIVVAPLAGITALVAVVASETVCLITWASTGTRTQARPMGKPDRIAVIAIGAATATIVPQSITIAAGAIAVGSVVAVIVATRNLLVRTKRTDGAHQS